MIQKLIPNKDAVFQEDDAPFTQPELFSHGLKSIFPDQHNHRI
jgi:hypothetical protein